MSLFERRDLGWLAYWGVVQTWRRFTPAFRWRHAWSLASLCARIWLSVSPAEQNRTMENMQRMLKGSRSKEELERINFEHHAAHVWAFVVPDILPAMSKEQVRAIGEVRGMEHLEKALSGGRGAVMLSAHYGTHGYVVIAILQAYGVPITAIAGREGTPIDQDEPEGSLFYRRVVHPVREAPRRHLPILTRSLVPDLRIANALKNNQVLWFQGDMHLTEAEVAHERQIVHVPFLWGEAPFRSGPVRLPKAFRVPILPTFGVRQGSRVIVEIEAPIPLTPGNRHEDIATDQRTYLDRLEPRILASPDQWAFTRHENLEQWVKPLSSAVERTDPIEARVGMVAAADYVGAESQSSVKSPQEVNG